MRKVETVSCAKSRALLAGASLLALGSALSLGSGTARAQAVGYTWTSGDYANPSGTTVNGSAAGVSVGAVSSVGTLTNSGTISGGIAISNSGTIDTINNPGQITGQTYGIQINNASRLNDLENTGTVIGNLGILVGQLVPSGTVNLGTLRNSGLIQGRTAAAVGTSANGTIGTLTNTGTIQSAVGAIGNSGVIGTLVNSGTIISAQYAIYNSGSIGTITNTGLIAGSITNASSNPLTIGGDSGTGFGTLTGSSGGTGSADKGLITNTNANLVFGFGNLLLNDDINITGNTVINNGATLKLANTVSITGNYSQNGGGLIVVATSNGASYGSLAVSGAATISRAAVTISGAGLSIGQTYTIVDAHTGSNYTTSSITASVAQTAGLNATVTTTNNGEDLVVTLVSASSIPSTPSTPSTPAASTSGYQQKGAPTGSAGGAMGAALDRIAAGNSAQAVAFQTDVLNVIDALPTAQQGQAIKQLAPSQNAPSSQMSAAAATAVLGAVEQHQQTAMAYDPATGAAAGSESRDSALWGQVLGGSARRGSTADADGYTLGSFGLATGLDHRFTPNAMGGVALSWVRTWSQGSDTSAGSSAILDSYQLTFYGTYRIDRAFVDGQLGLGWNEFDQKRAIDFLGATAHARYNGQQYLAKATAGYDLPVGATTVTPLVSLRWLRAVTDGYDETGAGAANLSVERRGINGLTQDLGGKLSWTLPTALGTLRPEARLAWVHDYTDSPIATSGLIGGQSFAVATPHTVADGVRVGLAASLSRDDALSFRAEYEGELRAHYQSHTGIIKAIWGF